MTGSLQICIMMRKYRFSFTGDLCPISIAVKLFAWLPLAWGQRSGSALNIGCRVAASQYPG